MAARRHHPSPKGGASELWWIAPYAPGEMEHPPEGRNGCAPRRSRTPRTIRPCCLSRSTTLVRRACGSSWSPRPGPSKPHPHLDLAATEVEAEIARLVGLGAQVAADHGHLVKLHDPDGNEFCILRPR